MKNSSPDNKKIHPSFASLKEAVKAFQDTYEEWSDVYDSLATK